MGIIQINTDPSRKELALFGVAWLVFFGVIGWLVWANTASIPAATALWAAAGAVPAVGWVAPKFMRLVYLGLSYVAFPIGLVISSVVLATVYYGVLTPTGLLLRLFGRDAMRRKLDRQAQTYWLPRRGAENVERYFRQF